MKTPKFIGRKFNNIFKLYEWLNENTFKVIHLEDKGQDMLTIWVHESGEILHSDFHSSIYSGKFVDMEKLEVGNCLNIWENEKEKYIVYGRLIIESLSDSSNFSPTGLQNILKLKTVKIEKLSSNDLMNHFEDAVCDRNYNPTSKDYNQSGFTHNQLRAEIMRRIEASSNDNISIEQQQLKNIDISDHLPFGLYLPIHTYLKELNCKIMQENHLNNSAPTETDNTSENSDFWVECNVCKTQLKNWTGSTPCCGSIAYIVEDGKPTKKISLFASAGGKPISPTIVRMTE